MSSRQVVLEGGPPWGFRIHGGLDVKIPLKVSRVNPGSKASSKGIRETDFITSINGKSTANLTNVEAHTLLRSSGSTLILGLNEKSEEPVPKRPYKTVHQEITQETIKKSSLKTYTLQETKDLSKNSSSTKKSEKFDEKEDLEYSKEHRKYSETQNSNNNQNGRLNKTPIASNSTSSATSTPSTLKASEGRPISSPDYAIASRQSSYSNCSSITDEGKNEEKYFQLDIEKSTMNNEAECLSKSKKRRLRRRNLIKGTNTNISKVEIEEITETSHEDIKDCKENICETNEKTETIIPQNENDPAHSLTNSSVFKTDDKAQNDTQASENHNIINHNGEVNLEDKNQKTLIKPKKHVKEEYKVESPKEIKLETIKINEKRLKAKSKSLDDEDFLKISELSETSESEDKGYGENKCIISEASSEENLLDDTPLLPKSKISPSFTLNEDDLNSIPKTLISPEEEKELRNFLGGLKLVNSSEQSAKEIYERASSQSDSKLKKNQKRQELEQYFVPVCQNPRFLDAISEETSDISDKECSSERLSFKQRTAELNLDAENGNGLEKTDIKSKVPKVPRKSRVLEQMCNQIEQEPAKLVETKIVEPINIQETVCTAQIQSEDALNAEIVFITDSNSSCNSSNTSSGDFSDVYVVTEKTEQKGENVVNNTYIDKENNTKINNTNKVERKNVTKDNFTNKNTLNLSEESLTTKISSQVSSSLKYLKDKDNLESRINFDSTQLTPPPTPESGSPKNEENHETTAANVLLFDYTKVPNTLTSKEPLAPHLKSVVANRVNLYNKSDTQMCSRDKTETIKEKNDTKTIQITKKAVTENIKKENIQVQETKKVYLKSPCESIESNNVSNKIDNLSKFIKSDVLREQKYERFVPVVNEVQTALKQREEVKRLKSINKKIQRLTKESIGNSTLKTEEHIIPIRVEEKTNNKKTPDQNEHIISIRMETEPPKPPSRVSSLRTDTKEHIVPIKVDKHFADKKKSKEYIIPIINEVKPLTSHIKPSDIKMNKTDIQINAVNEKETITNISKTKNEHIVPIKIEEDNKNVQTNIVRNTNTVSCIKIEEKHSNIKDDKNIEPKELIGENQDTESKTTDNKFTMPTDEERRAASPTLSDSSDSSDHSSVSTAKYNPTASIGDLSTLTKEENLTVKTRFEPKSLRDLVLNRLFELPFGLDILKELAEVSKKLDDYTSKLPFRGLTGHIPAFIEKDDSKLGENNPVSVHRSNMSENIQYAKESRERKIEEENIRLYQLHQNFHSGKEDLNDFEIARKDNEALCGNRLLSIIKEEPESQNDPNNFLYYEENQKGESSSQKLDDWLTLVRDKSKSTSNLSNTDHSINKSTRNANLKDQNSVRRRSLPQDLCEKQLRLIMEKEMEIQRELEWLEDEKRKIQAELNPSNEKFKMTEFKVSKQGDFAERKEKTRPLSMPVIPTEFFRQQMYEEYLDKFTERQERKQHKVLKISSSHDLAGEKEGNKVRAKEVIHPIELEQEFMSKVKEKLGTRRDYKSAEKEDKTAKNPTEENDHMGPPIIILDGPDVKTADSLPKHLQEVLDELTAVNEDDSIWSPGQNQRYQPTRPSLKDLPRSDSRESQNNGAITPVWTPKSATSSPVAERKEFRPVNFQSPVLSRRNRTFSETVHTPDSTSSEPPWKLNEGQSQPDLHPNSRDLYSTYSIDRRLPTSQSTPGFGSLNPSPRLPRAQNPTITLLQKAREGQLPRGAHYIEPQRPDPLERKVVPKPRVPVKLTGDYHIKSDYESDYDSERSRSRINDHGPKKYENFGPTTNDGMPIVLRSEIKEQDHSQWYKKMYDTIHKQKPTRDEYVTIRYRQKRAQYPYASGYMSEPEPGSYDSDFSEYKYQTLDRRRAPQAQYYYDTSTMPRSNHVPDKSYSSSDIVKNTQEKYNNKPGRIENYIPGKSSISDKEAKRWWDEVMDIFDGHLEQQKRVPTFSQPHNPKSFINQALKESGYESDSTLVFRRKEDNAAANLLSPKDQKQAYKTIQMGGDVPFQGLRKPAPEKPRETDLVEYFKLSPTLTKIRIHKNIVPQNEYFVYPATVHHFSPPTLSSLKRTVTVPRSVTPPLERAPSPPKRRSSRNNSTLRLISTMKVATDKSTHYKRHETCFSPGPSVDRSKINYLKDKISSKLSPVSKRRSDSPKIGITKKVSTPLEIKSKVSSSTLSRDPKNPIQKVQSSSKISSLSKPTEISRLYKSSSTSTISKKSSMESLSSRTSTPVRASVTEKRKFDFCLPKLSDSKLKITKTSPAEGLLSPNEVRKVLQGPCYKRSTVHLSRNGVLPIKIGMSSKAKDVLKPTAKRPVSLSPKVVRRITQSPKLAKKPSIEALCSAKSTKKAKTNSSTVTLNSKCKIKPEDTKNVKTKIKTNKNVVATASEKSNDSFQCLSKDTGQAISKKLDKTEITKQKEAIETNHFFRNLFLRNFEPNATFSYPRGSLILEKTHMLTRRRCSVPEPTVGAMKIYLKHMKPVSDSKFISLDIIRSRSTSPKSVTFSDSIGDIRSIGKRSKSLPSKIFFSQTSRPVSPVISKKALSPILKTPRRLKERSPSPPSKIVFTQTCRPLSPIFPKTLKPSPSKENLVTNIRSPSPQTKLFFSETSRPVSPEICRKAPLSPNLVRSPSSRKIMQFKQQNEGRKSHELTIYSCPMLNHSTTSLDSFRSEDYLKELSFSKPSEKFKDLNHFYTDIAKVGELEKTFDLKPRKRCENEIIDFERWQEVRSREKAEFELKHLYGHLKENEKEKGFLFRPKDVEKFRWKREYDRGLRNREKSVENIKFEFERLKYEESEREIAKQKEIAYSKDNYKPLWRGTSVLSLASLLTEKRSRSEGRARNTKQKILMEDEKFLTRGIGSRIWSSLSTEQVDNLKRQLQDIYGDDNMPKRIIKDSDVETKYVNIQPQHYSVEVPKTRAIKSTPKSLKLSVRRNSESSTPDPMTEDEKKMISYTLSKEVLEKIARKRREDKLALPLVVGKEMAGAIAAKEANLKVSTKKEEPVKALVKTDALKQPSTSETESASVSTDESTKTVVNAKDVQQKVQYFEKAKDLEVYIPTVHKPAEEGSVSVSSEDKEELSPKSDKSGSVIHSKSCQDLKEFFGESDLVKFATLPLAASRKTEVFYKKKPELRALDMSPIRTISETTSFDSLLRSRSVSPYSEEAQNLSKKGEVDRLKRQFEILEDIFGEKTLKRSKSENDLGNCGQVEDLRRKYEYPVHSGRGRSRTRKAGVVSPVYLRAEDRYMPHINIISKIATLYSASKKSSKKTGGSLKNIQELADILGCPLGEVERMKEKFDKLKEREEAEGSKADNVSLLGRMYTSSPTLKELRDITPYLTANWIAHKYPKSEDNTRSLSSLETSIGSRDTSLVRRDKARAKSSSPTKIYSSPTKKKVQQSILKKGEGQKKKEGTEGQRDSSRYIKDLPASLDLSPVTNLAVPAHGTVPSTHTHPAQPTPARAPAVESAPVAPPPPPPPPKSQQYQVGGILRSLSQESPRKYVENQVNIHYKTPVRQEIKEYVSEDELAHRQAEQMKKIYEQERRRKYLQNTNDNLHELQDMKSRRHTDNFIPSQKSPISLTRYDNLEELSPTTKTRPRSPEPRLVARALYNFVGQTSRELTFRKGDLIYVRKQIDKNWYEGELNAMVGLFPTNYVEIVPYEGMRTTTRKAHEGQARAKYNFVAQTHLELSLAKGELVTITRRVDDNWFEGKIGGRKGIFPMSYVEVLIDPSDPPPPSTKPVASPAAHSLLLNGSSQGKESMGSHHYTPIPTTPHPPSYHAKPVQLSGTGTYSTLPKPGSKSPLDQELRIETQSDPVPYRALYKYTPQNDDELELLENDLVYVLEKCDDGWFVGSSERTGAFGTFPGNYVEKVGS